MLKTVFKTAAQRGSASAWVVAAVMAAVAVARAALGRNKTSGGGYSPGGGCNPLKESVSDDVTLPTPHLENAHQKGQGEGSARERSRRDFPATEVSTAPLSDAVGQVAGGGALGAPKNCTQNCCSAWRFFGK